MLSNRFYINMDKDIKLKIKVLKIGFKMRFKGNVCKCMVIGKNDQRIKNISIGIFLKIG